MARERQLASYFLSKIRPILRRGSLKIGASQAGGGFFLDKSVST
jgi:hypothetical protein